MDDAFWKLLKGQSIRAALGIVWNVQFVVERSIVVGDYPRPLLEGRIEGFTKGVHLKYSAYWINGWIFYVKQRTLHEYICGYCAGTTYIFKRMHKSNENNEQVYRDWILEVPFSQSP